MRLPTQLSRKRNNVHKNSFGHVLILAGSRNMLGAAALSGLAAMHSGCGLVSCGVPKSLNSTLQKKISSVLMTVSLKETPQQSIAYSALKQILDTEEKYSAIAIGPGLSENPSTQKFILGIIQKSKRPLVIDADGLNAIAGNLSILKKSSSSKILTPHPGEMARLMKIPKKEIEKNRTQYAKDFSKKYNCILLLKGHRTVVALPKGHIYINKTGNSGMASAGSGDVLTGMIVAFLSQGLSAFEAAKYGAYLHGKSADLAAKKTSRISLIATDIIENISPAIKSLEKK